MARILTTESGDALLTEDGGAILLEAQPITPEAPDWPVRRDHIRIELLDRHHNVIGQIHPDLDSPPTVQTDLNATIPRKLTGLRLTPDEAADVDVIGDRIRPVWTLADVDWPLGVFVWSQASWERFGWGLALQGGAAHDLTLLVRQPLAEAFSVKEGAEIVPRIERLAEMAGIVDHDVTDSSQSTSTPLAWPAGTSMAKVMDTLCGKLGFVWWFDRHATLQVKPRLNVEFDKPDFWYEEGHVLSGSTEDDDVWERPNVFVVIDESSKEDSIRGVYRLPQAHRASEENRGFRVVKVVNESGLSSTPAAERRARQVADDNAPIKTIEISTVPRPQHDMHEIVAWRGESYVESGWSLPLSPGAAHKHTLTRTEDAT